MLETEFKSIIDEETYENVKNAYKWDYAQLQTNTYYTDKNGILGKNKIMVRVREKNGVFKVQVKSHKNAGSPLQICEETEFDISLLPEMISSEDAEKYTGMQVGELYKVGKLSTLRHSLMRFENVEICLDKSNYFDCEDLEIEVEYTGELPDIVMRELDKLGVKFDKPTVGKYTRFLNRMKELR